MRPLLAALLLCAPAAAQIKAVPEVAAPVGGGVAAAGSGASLSGPSLAAPLLAPTLAAPPGVLPSVQPVSAQAAPVQTAAALPASVVPTRVQTALASPAAAPAAPVKGLEGLQRKTGEMGDLLGREGGGAEAGAQAAGVASSIFDGGVKAGAVNGVSEDLSSPEGFGGGFSGSGSHFLRSLAANGVPSAPLGRLAELLKGGHPGDQARVYHGLSHSLRVANVAAAVLDGPAGRSLTPAQKATLLVAAALHDYDPEREAGKPARVSATLEVLDRPQGRALLGELGVDAAQVKALVKYTDFHPDAQERAKMRAAADAMAADQAWLKLWGPRLAFVDQSAMYTDSPAYARQAVIGLANELGAPADKVLAGTHNFLKPLIESADFALLPAQLQANFRAVHRYFVTLAESAPATPAAGAAQARAPPSDDPVAALSRLQESLASETRRGQAAADPEFYRKSLDLLTAQLKAWKASPRTASVRTDGTASGTQRLQQRYKKELLAAARSFLSGRTDGVRPLSESDVASTGASLETLLGILFTGGIEATNPYQGFKGESAHFWGAAGLETGAGYAAQRGVQRGEPGVLFIVHNAKDPVRVVAGETLSRRPTAAHDILAAVVSDGESTLVLQGPALATLAASSAKWKDLVVAEARRGRMGPFDAWERTQNRFDPDRR